MSVDLLSCPFCGSDDVQSGGIWGVHCKTCGALSPDLSSSDGQVTWNTRAPDPAVAVLEAEVERLRADLAYERRINGREAERIFVASLLADEIEVLTNSPSSFDVQDGIALTAFQKRLIGLWRVRDSLPAPSEKEAG